MLKIDEKDKKLLYALSQNSRITETSLAKLITRSRESVRYRLEQLEKKKIIINYTIWIDPIQLGYRTGKFYFTLANNPKRKEEFRKYITQDQRVFWLGFAQGAWNAGVTYFIRSNKEFFEIKNDLLAKFSDIILTAQLTSIVEVGYKNNTAIYPQESNWTSIFLETDIPTKIDETEKRILRSLFENSRTNLINLAKKTSNTIDIVRHRMKKMEEKKIISRYTVQIDNTKLGLELYKTFCYFQNLTKQEEKRFFEYCKTQSPIIHFIKNLSAWDIELELLCKNYQEYLEQINLLTINFAKIIKIETAIISEDYVFPAKKMVFE